MRLVVAVFAILSAPALAQSSHLGITLPGLAGPPERRIQVAKELGATWYRPAPVLLAGDGKCDDCEAARNAGLKISLAMRNGAAAGKPSGPVGDVGDFKKRLRVVLEREKPAMLAVEEEPDDPKKYSGTPDDYRTELVAACEVSHELKIPCSNGGLSSRNVALLVIDQRFKADPIDAANVATTTELVRAESPGTNIHIFNKSVGNVGEKQTPAVEATRKYLDKHQQEIDRTRQFVDAINQAHVDRLNFQWYELQPDNLPRVLDSLHQLSKLDLMSDEMGDRSDRAFVVGEKIKVALENYVWPTIWMGTNSNGAQGLVDKNGKLLPRASAFQSEARSAGSQ